MKQQKLLLLYLILNCFFASNSYGQSKQNGNNNISNNSEGAVEGGLKNDLLSSKLTNLLIETSTENFKKLDEERKRSSRYTKQTAYAKNVALLLRELKEVTQEISDHKTEQERSLARQRINNPVDEILGSRFSDVIISNLEIAIDENIKEEQNDSIVNNIEKNKKSFLSKIKSFVELISPIFPPLDVIGKIVDKIDNTTVTVKVWKTGEPHSNAKHLSIENQPLFRSKVIDSFLNKTKPYLEFYQMLSKNNVRTENELKVLEIKYSSTVKKTK